MKNIVYIVIAVIIAIAAVWFFTQDKEGAAPAAGDIEAQQNSGETVDVDQLKANIVGTWESVDDANSIVTYNNNGTFRSLYDGAEMQNGTWEMFTLDGADGGPAGNFIRIHNDLDTTGGEDVELAVVEAAGDTLTLSLLGRGNTLEYRRVVEESLAPGL